MMKKWGKFILLTIVLIAVILVVTNFSAIYGAILRFPIDWVIAYLVGAATMYLAFANKKSKKNPEA